MKNVNKRAVGLVILATLNTTSNLAVADTDGDLVALAARIESAWHEKDGQWKLVDSSATGTNAKCKDSLERLQEAKVPDTATFEIKADSRDLKKGTHTLLEAKVACDQIERFGHINAYKNVVRMVLLDESLHSAEYCAKTYKELLALGIPASQRVIDGTIDAVTPTAVWSGTIEELRIKYCDPALKAQSAKTAEKEAPYRKVLKNDKLEMALATRTGYTVLGGFTTMEPDDLAKSAVWFDALSDQLGKGTCPGGVQRKTLRRYQFDRQHRLLKETQKDFCGTIPKSALK